MSLTAITELNAKMKAAHDEIVEIAKREGSAIVAELFAPLWETGVVATSWHQYTPYFNDGEPCEFGVYAEASEMPVTWAGGPDWEDGDGYPDEKSIWDAEYHFKEYTPAKYRSDQENERYRIEHEAKAQQYVALGLTPEKVAEAKAVLEEITKVLNANEEMLKAAFGDHVLVKVTPEGVEVEDYDHE